MNRKTLTISCIIVFLALAGVGCNTDESTTEAPALDIQVLERVENPNGSINLVFFTSTPELLTEKTAKDAAQQECGENCNMIYFFDNKDAYALNALKRKRYTDPNAYFNGDIKRMVKAEKDWMAENGNWEKVKKGLKATLFQGEYSTSPL